MVTRYIAEYTYPEKMKAKDKTPVNAAIEQIPFQVSDEEFEAEVEAEAREEAITEITQAKIPDVRARKLAQSGA